MRPFEGLGAALGAGGGAGFGASKNPPPRRGGEDIWDAAGGDLALLKLVRLANGDGFWDCGCRGGGDVEDEKLRPLKASLSPPKDDC